MECTDYVGLGKQEMFVIQLLHEDSHPQMIQVLYMCYQCQRNIIGCDLSTSSLSDKHK